MPDFAQMISVTSSDGRFDDVFLSNFATLRLRDQLKRISGVSAACRCSARLTTRCGSGLDPEKLEVRNLTTGDVLAAIREQNVQVAAGKGGRTPGTRWDPVSVHRHDPAADSLTPRSSRISCSEQQTMAVC